MQIAGFLIMRLNLRHSYKEKAQFDKEKAQSGRNSHSKNRGGKKSKLTIGTYTKKTYCKPNEQLFPNRRPVSYPNLTKTVKTYIRFKQHKNSTPKHI